MLYVSDKTISRWENDECAPDLYLVPAIADIFGISADELIRGERNAAGDASETPYTAARTEKQIKAMLAGKFSKLRSLSFIPLGLALAGVIAAVICALVTVNCTDGYGYHTEVSWLGFIIACVLCAGGIICEVCFALNAFQRPDEEFDDYSIKCAQHNARVLALSSAVIFIETAVLFFYLPLLAMDSRILQTAPLMWPGIGLNIAGIAVCLAYLIYCKTIRRKCVENGMAIYPEGYTVRAKRENKTLAIIATVCTAIFIALTVLNIVFPELVQTSGTASVTYFLSGAYHILMIAVALAGAAVYAALRAASKKTARHNQHVN